MVHKLMTLTLKSFKWVGLSLILISLNSCVKNSAKPILQVPDSPTDVIGNSNQGSNDGVGIDFQPTLPDTQGSTIQPDPTTPEVPGNDTTPNTGIEEWDGLSHDIGSGLIIE